MNTNRFMITGVVLTRNEERNIKECIRSLDFCDEIIVIDDNSTDKTLEIVKSTNAKLLIHSLNDNFAQQRNFALKKAKGDWIFFLDADERVSDELKKEIKNSIKESDDFAGYTLKRRDYFLGRWLD